jgi:hypothetical protein
MPEVMPITRRGQYEETNLRGDQGANVGGLAYLVDLIANLNMGTWLENCPQLMPRTRGNAR